MNRTQSESPRFRGFSFGLSLVFVILVTFLLAFELVQCETPSEEDAGSPCYEKGEDGKDDITKPQVSLVFFFSNKFLHELLNTENKRKNEIQFCRWLDSCIIHVVLIM